MGSMLGKIKHRVYAETTNEETYKERNEAIIQRRLTVFSRYHNKHNPYRIFLAEELELATNNYDSQNVIKHGAVYTLYKGFWQEGSISVMKFGHSRNRDVVEYSFNNIVYAAQMKHKNIIKLIGCCLEDNFPIVVFEYVESGTLADRIFGAPQPQFEPLLLTQRLKIAIDIANAVAYLHVGFPRPIIFRDIMPSNILFNEQNDAKLFDFSVSLSIPDGETHVIEDEEVGTIGYIAPEYLSTYYLNEKCDVYSFGIFLIELLTGQKAVDVARRNLEYSREAHLRYVEYLKKRFEKDRVKEIIGSLIVEDSSCPGKGQQLQHLGELITECLNFSPLDRPTMVDVAKRLGQIYGY